MKIIIGESAGFCFGMNRALKQAATVLNNTKKAYCLGDLAHNKQVMQKFAQQGLMVIDRIDNIEPGLPVLVRPHGITKEVYQHAQNHLGGVT